MECSWTVVAPTEETAQKYFDEIFPGRREKLSRVGVALQSFKEGYGYLAHTKKYGREVSKDVFVWESKPYDERPWGFDPCDILA